jgi:hypothetical protein
VLENGLRLCVLRLAIIDHLAGVEISVDSVSKHGDIKMTCSLSQDPYTIVVVEVVARGSGFTLVVARGTEGTEGTEGRRELRIRVENTVTSQNISVVKCSA